MSADFNIFFIDFEVFKKFWCCVIYQPAIEDQEEKYFTFYYNHGAPDSPDGYAEFREFYYKYAAGNQYEQPNTIFIGWNIRGYDQYIMRAILKGLPIYNIKRLNDFIIRDKEKPLNLTCSPEDRPETISMKELMYEFPINFYDCMIGHNGLKTVEGFMGSDIRETTVPFNYSETMNQEQIDEILFYCAHDVEQTYEAFCKVPQEFQSHIGLIDMFALPLQNMIKTKAQLSAIALQCNNVNFGDEFEIKIVDSIKLNKYRWLFDEFKNMYSVDDGKDKNNKDKRYMKCIHAYVEDSRGIAGVNHEFGWGGIHGAKEAIERHNDGIRIYHVDVSSYYPALMIEYDFLTRAAKDKSKFRQIRDQRLIYKHNKDARQAPMKIIINGTYGISKDIYSKAYDPLMANNVCINGQLMLVMLIERLEVINGFELLQSNTDGLIVTIPDRADIIEQFKNICTEWENDTRMQLATDEIKQIFQKDVNNYIFEFINGKIESKGAYVKHLTDTDYDLPIVNKAIKNYFLKNISAEETIKSCNDLREFQKIVKIQTNYLYARHNYQNFSEKVFRVFASVNLSDTSIFKVKDPIKKPEGEKFANTPEHCFIDNSDVRNKSLPAHLDINWYIDLANKRINDFKGIEVKKPTKRKKHVEYSLFDEEELA